MARHHDKVFPNRRQGSGFDYDKRQLLLLTARDNLVNTTPGSDKLLYAYARNNLCDPVRLPLR